MRRVRKQERGILLLIAMVFVVVLTLLGSMVLREVAADVQVAGAERNTEDALYIAEAGLQWGRDQIMTQFGSGGTVDLSSSSAIWTTLSLIPNTDPDVQLHGWYDLGTQSYGAVGGKFHVAVEQDPADSSGDSILMRSMGTSPGGAKRLLEVAVVKP